MPAFVCPFQLNKLREALDDCSNAIKNDEGYIKAYLKRAKLYQDLGQYEESVRDYELIYSKQKTKGQYACGRVNQIGRNRERKPLFRHQVDLGETSD